MSVAVVHGARESPWRAGCVLLFALWAGSANAITVNVAAGANIQTSVDANAAGTTYQLAAGTYSGQTVTPKTGDIFVGAPGRTSIMDGGGGVTEKHAFTAGSAIDNVTIDRLAIRNYVDSSNPNLTRGVLNITPSNTGWTIKNSDIGPNVGVGVEAVSGITIKNNLIHDNSWLGINGYTGSSNILIDNNDIYNNNTDRLSAYGATAFASGIKLFNITNITLSNNKIHGNYGAGIWFDTDWNGVVIDSNEIFGQLRDVDHSGSSGIGIFMEIGLAGGAYTDNRISNNYIHDQDIGIFISTASDMDIYGNAFDASIIAPIRSHQTPRGTGPNGVVYKKEHVHIHNNYIAYSQGTVSERDGSSGFLWQQQDNTYTNNEYWVSCGTGASGNFAFEGESFALTQGNVLSRTQWNALTSAPDSTSTFNCGTTSLPDGVGPRGGFDENIALVAHYRFDETAGTSAADSSGNALTGTASGGPTWVGGIIGNSLALDGVNDFVSVADNAALEPSTNMTLASWIKLNVLPSTRAEAGHVFRKAHSVSPSHSYYLQIDTGNVVKAEWVNTGSTPFATSGATALEINRWYHVAFTKNGTLGTVYLNGVSNGTNNSHTGTMFSSDSSLNIGVSSSSGGRTDGTLDDVRVYDAALTASEVRELYDQVRFVELFPPRPIIRMR